MRIESQLMRGAGPLAVMHLLSGGEKYGYEMVQSLTRRTQGVLEMGQSTLYPMLYNLEAKRLIASRIDESGSRPRKYYRLTDKGRRHLARQSKQWQSLCGAMTDLGLIRPTLAIGGGR